MSAEANPIRILVVDDHPVVRQGVAGLVGGHPDMSIVGQAANGREAIQQFRAHHPDVVLMDLADAGDERVGRTDGKIASSWWMPVATLSSGGRSGIRC